MPLDPPEPKPERPRCYICGAFLGRTQYTNYDLEGNPYSYSKINKWCKKCQTWLGNE